MSQQNHISHTAVVVDTSHSPHAQLQPLALNDVRLQDTFWVPRLEVNRKVTLLFQYQQCEETGRLDNFRRAGGTYQGPFQGTFFNDSDVYKWVEAASWSLATHPDPELTEQVDKVIALIAAAQEENGYLNTYFMFERAAERWTDLRVMHEMYCAGHLIQAAVAHHRATGSKSLLNVAVRLADHILATFGPNARSGACGHPEIELALVELARDTGDTRYLQEAQFFIDQRGQHLPNMSGKEYDQDHAPIREQAEIVGHAVRALYLYAGATDIYAETGEAALQNALEALWHNFTERKMYITGGAGARYEGEAFGHDYELPNDRAYTETCAAIASLMWNWRLLQLKGEARFADMIETALYNGILSGTSLTGEEYFYQNPLADNGKHRRQPWFKTACCPPNIARLFASLPGYLYSTSEEGLWVHLYIASTATATLSNGQSITIQQQTNYPWESEIQLTLQLQEPARFSLFARIPAWATEAAVKINGVPADTEIQPGSYARLHRTWQSGDVIEISLPQPVRLVESNPLVANNRHRVAVMRGPLVYCVEQADQSGCDIRDIVLPTKSDWQIVNRPDLLGGIVTIQTEAYAAQDSEQHTLYRPYGSSTPTLKPVQLTAIPYYAWANRDAGAMQVWLPIEQDGSKGARKQ